MQVRFFKVAINRGPSTKTAQLNGSILPGPLNNVTLTWDLICALCSDSLRGGVDTNKALVDRSQTETMQKKDYVQSQAEAYKSTATVFHIYPSLVLVMLKY